MTYDADKNAKDSWRLVIDHKRAKLLQEKCPAAKRVVVIGDCELYEGDCLEIMPFLDKVDAVVTDPPYGFGAASVSGVNNQKVSRFADLMNQSYFFREIITQSRLVLKENSCIWMFQNWRGFPVLMKGVVEAGAHIESLLVWDKEWIGPGGSVGLRPSYELCALIPFGEFSLPNRGLPDIWRHKWASQKPNGHPAEKPISLMVSLVSQTPASVIIDPFMGSGTTGAACVKLRRRFVGVEVDPHYFNIACERIRKAYAQPDLFIESAKAPEPKQEPLL